MPLRPVLKVLQSRQTLVILGPVASRGSLLFFLMMELSKMHTFYKQPGTCFTEELLVQRGASAHVWPIVFFTICLGCDCI